MLWGYEKVNDIVRLANEMDVKGKPFLDKLSLLLLQKFDKSEEAIFLLKNYWIQLNKHFKLDIDGIENYNNNQILDFHNYLVNSIRNSSSVSGGLIRKSLDKFFALEQIFSIETAFNSRNLVILEKAFDNQLADQTNNTKSVEILAETIMNVGEKWDSNTYASPTFTIINASMMGKSRHIKELSSRMFVISICLRGKDSMGIPVRTPHVCEFFSESFFYNRKLFVLHRFVVFISVCLKMLNEFIDKYNGETENICSAWFKHQDVTFWKRVEWQVKSSKMIANHDNYCLENNEAINDPFDHHRLLREVIGNWSRDKCVTFAFDESRCLAKPLFENGKSTFLSFLRLAFSCVPNKIVGVFLDTISHLETWYPSQFEDPSFRLSNGTQQFPPYWRLYWWDSWNEDITDDHIKKISKNENDKETAKLICKRIQMARPAWWVYFIKGVNDLPNMARKKILCGSESTISNESTLLAIATCRLCLNIRSFSVLAKDLVGKHCAICLKISTDCSKMSISYCSDPMLMEGAAQVMNENGNVGRILEALLSNMMDGIVEAGIRGEIVARLLILFGMDRVKRSTERFKYQKPVSLNSWLNETFRYSEIEELLHTQCNWKSTIGEDQWPSNFKYVEPKSSFEQLLNGLVSFNSFVLCDKNPLNNDLKLFYERGHAILCTPGQMGVDLIIPIRINETEYSFVLIQVKNRTQDQMIKLADSGMDISKISSSLVKPFAYLAIHMSLHDNMNVYRNVDIPTKEATFRKGKLVKHSHCYQYVSSVCGLSRELYPCIPANALDILKQMLCVYSGMAELKVTRSDSEKQDIKNQLNYLKNVLVPIYDTEDSFVVKS